MENGAEDPFSGPIIRSDGSPARIFPFFIPVGAVDHNGRGGMEERRIAEENEPFQTHTSVAGICLPLLRAFLEA